MRLAAALFAAAAALAVAGCGGGEEAQPLPEGATGTTPAPATTAEETQTSGGTQGDAAAGKEIYASEGCGSCHTLQAAGSTGTIGPNLDDAKPDVALIVERVTNGASPMPSFKDSLSEQQIQDVAAFVFESTH